MMPSRTALILLSCATCLSYVRTSGAIAQTLPTETNRSLVFPLLAQNKAPNPQDNPIPIELFPTPGGKTSSSPAAKPKPKANAFTMKSKWPLFWMGSGAVLVVVAGILLFWLKRSDSSLESDDSETPSLETGESQENPILEDEENSFSESSLPETHTNHLDFNSSAHFQPMLSAREDPTISESPPSKTADTLEVQETTRLAKINIVDELIKELQSPNPTTRNKAIWELAQRGDSRAIQPLVNSLMDADSKQRCLILEAVSQIGHRTLKPLQKAMVISLQDDNAEVRKNAIRDVTRIYELMSQITQLLRHAVDDPDAEVQETARWAMTQMNRLRGASGVEHFPTFPNSNNREKPPN